MCERQSNTSGAGGGVAVRCKIGVPGLTGSWLVGTATASKASGVALLLGLRMRCPETPPGPAPRRGLPGRLRDVAVQDLGERGGRNRTVRVITRNSRVREDARARAVGAARASRARPSHRANRRARETTQGRTGPTGGLCRPARTAPGRAM